VIESQMSGSEANTYLSSLREKRLESDRTHRKQFATVDSQSGSLLPDIKDRTTKIDMAEFKPKSEILIGMTPFEKQEFIDKLKQVKKLNVILEARDPENLIEQVKEGKLNPCEMKAKKQDLIEANKQRANSNVRTFKKSKKSVVDPSDKKARAKSVERAAIKLAFSGMNELENNHFEDLLKHTMKQISEVSN